MYFKVDFLAYNRSFTLYQVFPGGSDSKESTCNAGDLGSIPGLGRSPGEGDGNSLKYSGLENSMQSMGSQRVRHNFHFHSHFHPQFSSVAQSPRHFVTPWTAACPVSLSITNSWSLLKLMSIASVMPSNHLILCHPLLLQPSIFPSIKVFSNGHFLTSGGQNIGFSDSASLLSTNIED